MTMWVELIHFLQSNAPWLAAAGGLLLLLALIRSKSALTMFALKIRVYFPGFGLLARSSRQLRQDSVSGWFHAEQSLCRAYRPHTIDLDAQLDTYDQSISYLRKCQELGRQRLSRLGWLIIAAMVFLEAIGFSYVLAGYTLPGASEALKQQGAVGIAFLVSVLLVFMTHYSGHELHHNDLVRKIRVWFHQSGASEEQLEPNTQVSLANDDADNHEPAWCQLLNRLPTNADITPTYRVTVATVIMVVMIAVGATYVRGQVLEQDNLEQQRVGQAYDMPTADLYSERFVPVELEDEQRLIDQRLDEESRLADMKAGWGTFIVLAVIFVFLQILSIIMGYRTGFAAREAAIARTAIGHFKTRQQFLADLDRKQMKVVIAAQTALEHLQERMLKLAEVRCLEPEILERLQRSGERTFQRWLEGRQGVLSKPAELGSPSPHAPLSPPSAPRTNTALQIVTAGTAAPAANQSETQLPDESEILAWMERFGWSRRRTVAALIKHRTRQHSEPADSDDTIFRIKHRDLSKRKSQT